MFTDSDRTRMADIVNKAIASTEFGPDVGVLSKDDFSYIDNSAVIYFSSTFTEAPDTLLNVFSACAVDRRLDGGHFYHFKSVERAIDILDTGTVQLTALYYQAENDRAEYSEFLQRTGYFRPLNTGDIDEMKRKSFVLCVTKSASREKFWNQYAKQDTGVCLGLRYDMGQQQLQGCVDFRDVTYETGYRFDFINEIRDQFKHEFGKEPFIEGILKFARFYKRGKYSWEDESRISFDYMTYPELCNVFPIQRDVQNGKITREYIIVPLKNEYFTLDVDEIICGKQVNSADQARLLSTSKLDANRVWVRK